MRVEDVLWPVKAKGMGRWGLQLLPQELGVLSKMGAYGFIKLAIPLCPDVAPVVAPAMVGLAVVSILYGAVLALRAVLDDEHLDERGHRIAALGIIELERSHQALQEAPQALGAIGRRDREKHPGCLFGKPRREGPVVRVREDGSVSSEPRQGTRDRGVTETEGPREETRARRRVEHRPHREPEGRMPLVA